VAFQWDVAPALGGKELWLLAFVAADNDELNTAGLDVGVLVPQRTKCALKKVQAEWRFQSQLDWAAPVCGSMRA
jgi:hypothetical protein